MIGYIRRDDANCEIAASRQRLEDMGASNVLTEIRSAGSIFHPILDQAIDQLQPDGALIVLSLADLARDPRDIFAIIGRIARKEAYIIIPDAGIDTRIDGGVFYMTCRALADHARGRGLTVAPPPQPGRKPSLTDEAAQEAKRRLKAGEWSIPEATVKLGVSRATLYRSLRRIEPDQAEA